jgi:hypothetical protein
MYFQPLGLDKTSWCSDRNPQGNCKPLKDICKPMDYPDAELFKKLQRELNRALYMVRQAGKTSQKPLWVDARPGPLTIKACNTVLGTSFTHCDEFCAKAESLLTSLSTWNAASGAPATVAGGKPPAGGGAGSGVDLGPMDPGKDVHQAGFTAMLKSPLGIGALIIGGLLLWKATEKPKRKKKTKKRRARRKAKRRVIHTWY